MPRRPPREQRCPPAGDPRRADGPGWTLRGWSPAPGRRGRGHGCSVPAGQPGDGQVRGVHHGQRSAGQPRPPGITASTTRSAMPPPRPARLAVEDQAAACRRSVRPGASSTAPDRYLRQPGQQFLDVVASGLPCSHQFSPSPHWPPRTGRTVAGNPPGTRASPRLLQCTAARRGLAARRNSSGMLQSPAGLSSGRRCRPGNVIPADRNRPGPMLLAAPSAWFTRRETGPAGMPGNDPSTALYQVTMGDAVRSATRWFPGRALPRQSPAAAPARQHRNAPPPAPLPVRNPVWYALVAHAYRRPSTRPVQDVRRPARLLAAPDPGDSAAGRHHHVDHRIVLPLPAAVPADHAPAAAVPAPVL